MTHTQQIAALNWEAVRRGTSYGKLMISLSTDERQSIYDSFLADLEAKNAEEEKRAAKIRRSPEKSLAISQMPDSRSLSPVKTIRLSRRGQEKMA